MLCIDGSLRMQGRILQITNYASWGYTIPKKDYAIFFKWNSIHLCFENTIYKLNSFLAMQQIIAGENRPLHSTQIACDADSYLYYAGCIPLYSSANKLLYNFWLMWNRMPKWSLFCLTFCNQNTRLMIHFYEKWETYHLVLSYMLFFQKATIDF